MITKHPDDIPDGYSPMRYLYGVITGKYKGECMYCSNETEWNEATGKYGRICGSTKCRDRYAADHQLLSPAKQREMLAKRKISSIYNYDGVDMYYTGKYELRFLEFMKNVMEWPASDILSPSPNTYYYEYVNPEDKYHEGVKFYIPDFYIPSLNLEIEIKDQTTTHPKFLKIDKVKEACKDKRMKQLQNKVNYFKVNDNDFEPLLRYLERMKLSFDDAELLYAKLKKANESIKSSKATESLAFNEQADALARELFHHERVITWMNDTHLTLIDYCESIDELDELFDEWNSMSETDKAISDRQSIEFFGVDNITHYQNLKRLLTDIDVFLPHVYDAQNVESGATEGYVKNHTMGVIELMNSLEVDTTVESTQYGLKDISKILDKIATHSLIYQITMRGYVQDHDKPKFVVTHDVPIFYIATTTVPLHYEPKLGKYGGLYAGSSVRSILNGVSNRMREALETDGMLTEDVKLEVGYSLDGSEPESYEEYVKNDSKLYKVSELSDLVSIVDIIAEDELQEPNFDEIEHIRHLQNPISKTLDEKVSGVNNLALRVNQYMDYTLPRMLNYVYYKANKIFQQMISEYKNDIFQAFGMVKKYSTSDEFKTDLFCSTLAEIKFGADLQETVEILHRIGEICTNYLEEYVYVNMTDSVEIEELKNTMNRLKSDKNDAYMGAFAQILAFYESEMYTHIVLENKTIFKNMADRLGQNEKILFVTPYPYIIKCLKSIFEDHEYCELTDDIADPTKQIHLGICGTIAGIQNLPEYSTIVTFGINGLLSQDEMPDEIFGRCKNENTVIHVTTLDTGSIPNISGGISKAVADAQDIQKFLTEVDVGKIMGYESYCNSDDFNEVAYEGFITHKSVPMNLDKLHLKHGSNVLYVVTNNIDFCKKQPILTKFENIVYFNIDAILLGEDNSNIISLLNSKVDNYTSISKKYRSYIEKSARDQNVYGDKDDYTEYMSQVMSALYDYADANTDKIIVIYGHLLTSAYRCHLTSYPFIIDDYNYIKSCLDKAGDECISGLFYTNKQRYYRINRMVRSTNDLRPNNIKIAKGNNSDPVFYHVSSDRDLKTLVPRVPESTMFGENIAITRSCVSTDVGKCLNAIPSNRFAKGSMLYVYRVNLRKGTRYYKPSTVEVPDQKATNEYWLLDDVTLSLDHAIIISDIKHDKASSGKSRKVYGARLSNVNAMRKAEKLKESAFTDDSLNISSEHLFDVSYM